MVTNQAPMSRPCQVNPAEPAQGPGEGLAGEVLGERPVADPEQT